MLPWRLVSFPVQWFSRKVSPFLSVIRSQTQLRKQNKEILRNDTYFIIFSKTHSRKNPRMHLLLLCHSTLLRKAFSIWKKNKNKNKTIRWCTYNPQILRNQIKANSQRNTWRTLMARPDTKEKIPSGMMATLVTSAMPKTHSPIDLERKTEGRCSTWAK